jgi:assimilatory nitrate reductase catalytic subunit
MSLRGTEVAPRQFPTNAGGLCQKGWTSGALLDSPARLTSPLIRVDGELRPASWADALDLVANKLTKIQAEHGLDAAAVFGGGGLTNEKAYLLGKFARVALGTSQIDYNGRFCMSSAAAAGNRAFGLDRGLPFPVTDLAEADAVLLVGANPAETMPPFAQHLRGSDLIVVDPRRTPTAELASLHLAPAPGTDLALALGILHAVVADGQLDQSYVDDRTSGFAEAWRIAAAWWPERVERITGVAAADQRRVAAKLATARNAYVLTARGTEQHASGADMVSGWINLALALGLPGRTGSGFGCLRCWTARSTRCPSPVRPPLRACWRWPGAPAGCRGSSTHSPTGSWSPVSGPSPPRPSPRWESRRCSRNGRGSARWREP